MEFSVEQNNYQCDDSPSDWAGSYVGPAQDCLRNKGESDCKVKNANEMQILTSSRKAPSHLRSKSCWPCILTCRLYFTPNTHQHHLPINFTRSLVRSEHVRTHEFNKAMHIKTHFDNNSLTAVGSEPEHCTAI